MSIEPMPSITTKDEYASLSMLLMLGLTAIMISGDTPSRSGAIEGAIGIRRALESAPFVMARVDGKFVAVDATPETKAAENASMDRSFAAVGIEIPAAEPAAV